MDRDEALARVFRALMDTPAAEPLAAAESALDVLWPLLVAAREIAEKHASMQLLASEALNEADRGEGETGER